MKAAVLRLDSPLMSFGGVVVDNLGYTDVLPGRSMLTGLLANALGYERHQADDLAALQAALQYAARADVPGEVVVDYQTADLSTPWMTTAWTTRGAPEERKAGTHIRHRHFVANAATTVVLTLGSSSPIPLEAVGEALTRPARPLFIGRKPCLPARPIFDGYVDGESLRSALASVRPYRSSETNHLARWPQSDGPMPGARLVELADTRDWKNQVHVGRSKMYEGMLETLR